MTALRSFRMSRKGCCARLVLGIVFCALALATSLPAQDRFEGKLDATLTRSPTPIWNIKLMPQATPSQRALLPIKLSRSDLVWISPMRWKGLSGLRTVAVVDQGENKVFLVADINNDGKLGAEEVRRFQPVPGAPGTLDLEWAMPQKSGPFRSYPILFRVLKSNSGTGKQPLHINDSLQVTGTVEINGKTLKVAYDYDPDVGVIDPSKGLSGVDLDGDGRVDFYSNSVESALASGTPVVFRVDKLYVSTLSVDLRTLRFTMRTHPASDYDRIEPRPGKLVPD